MHRLVSLLRLIYLSFLCTACGAPFDLKQKFDAWNEPVPPFHVLGNIYFVGMRNISSFLLVGEQGHILIDTGFSNSVPIIRSNIVRLGFSPKDIKLILSSHAHCDHVAGHAEMKRITGAKIAISKKDAALLRSGGAQDFLFGPEPMMHFEPLEPDMIVKDGEDIHLGRTRLTAHLTPGHTPGCTTWSMVAEEKGRIYHVLFFGSTSINPGTKFVRNREYPEIVEDLQGTYRTLRGLPCDVFLAPHPEQFRMEEKLSLARERSDAFVDPAELGRYLDEAESAFKKEWKRQHAAP